MIVVSIQTNMIDFIYPIELLCLSNSKVTNILILMGRRNKKQYRIERALQSNLFLMNKDNSKDLSNLSKEEKRLEIAHLCNKILSCPELHVIFI